MKKKIGLNLRTRFFSIMLGLIASATILFIVHILLDFVPKWEWLAKLMKDEAYSYLTKTAFAVIFTTIFVLVFEIASEISAKVTLDEMNKRYKDLSIHAIMYFQSIFQFRDSLEDNIVLSAVLKNYSALGEKKQFVVSLNTYLELVISFLKQGYSLTSINSTLIPFWYSPQTIDDDSVSEYTSYFKLHEKKIDYCRITYYQNSEWKDDTVGMIFKDLLNSEGEAEYAITWLITLLSNTGYSDSEIKSLIDFEENINYLKQSANNDTIKKIKEISADQAKRVQFTGIVISHSKKINEAVMLKFKESMGEKGSHWCWKAQYETKFGKFIKEIGYFEKDKSAFVINLIGRLSDTVTLQIISEQQQLGEIKQSIDNLKELNASKK
jgi:hypothetical protein